MCEPFKKHFMKLKENLKCKIVYLHFLNRTIKFMNSTSESLENTHNYHFFNEENTKIT